MNPEEKVTISIPRLQELLSCEIKLNLIKNASKSSETWELASFIQRLFNVKDAPEENTDA